MAHHKIGALLLGAFLLSGLSAQTGETGPGAPLIQDHPPAGTKPPGTDPLWRQALGGAVIGIPVTQAESVVVVCDGGNLKAYSRQGRLLWDYFARGRLSPFITRSREGTSYICRTNGTLIAVNRSGRELWQIPGSPLTAPVLVGWTAGSLFPRIKRSPVIPPRGICYGQKIFPIQWPCSPQRITGEDC